MEDIGSKVLNGLLILGDASNGAGVCIIISLLIALGSWKWIEKWLIRYIDLISENQRRINSGEISEERRRQGYWNGSRWVGGGLDPKYHTLVIVCCCLILLGTLGFMFWDQYRMRSDSSSGTAVEEPARKTKGKALKKGNRRTREEDHDQTPKTGKSRLQPMPKRRPVSNADS